MGREIKERLQSFIRAKGISPSAAGLMAGRSKDYFGRVDNFGSDFVADLLHHFPDLSAEWVMRGEGEMMRQAMPPQTEQFTTAIHGNINAPVNTGVNNGDMTASITPPSTDTINLLMQTIKDLRAQLKDKQLIIDLLKARKA